MGYHPDISTICDHILMPPRKDRRRMIAVAGPPASGKSTLAENLAAAVSAAGSAAVVMPMDGFHLDNAILRQHQRLDRKGAPDTFDVAGFQRTLFAVSHEPEVYIPVFDRTRDIAIAAGAKIDASCDTIIVEGNYLLLDQDQWRLLQPLWDLSIFVHAAIDALEQRLLARWNDLGLPADVVSKKVYDNDLVNARLVLERSAKADVTVTT